MVDNDSSQDPSDITSKSNIFTSVKHIESRVRNMKSNGLSSNLKVERLPGLEAGPGVWSDAGKQPPAPTLDEIIWTMTQCNDRL